MAVASGKSMSKSDSTSARGTQPQAGRAAPRQERRARTAPLSALKRRVQQRVEAETKAVWQDLQHRADHLAAQFRQRMRVARRSLTYAFAGFVACGLAATKIPLLWLGVVLSALAFLGKLSGPRINGRSRSPLSLGGTWLSEAAKAEATGECSTRAAGLQRYQSELASIAEL